tara:strand:- start:199 stop:321 length:123 start_codon:yes stop_codon:yes gene_type:complete
VCVRQKRWGRERDERDERVNNIDPTLDMYYKFKRISNQAG